MGNAHSNNRLSMLILGLAVVSVCIGIYLRLRGIGLWSLAIDEYFFASSVDNILEKGLPAFDCGGFYTRGLIYQYLQAAALSITDFDTVTTMRVINAASNLLMLPAAFLLAHRLSRSVNVALIVLALLSLSLWEIEFARYLRMYAPFQALFMWYVLFVYRVVVDREAAMFPYMILLSILSIFLYAASIFLALLNFLPALYDARYRRPLILTLLFGIGICAYLFLSQDFRHLGVTDFLPPDIAQLGAQAASGGRLSFPHILALTMPNHPLWLISFVLVLLASVFPARAILGDGSLSLHGRIALVLILGLSAFNLFSLAVYGMMLLLLLQWLPLRALTSRSVIYLLGAGIVYFLFWMTYAFVTPEWRSWFPPENFYALKKILVVFFKYPDVYTKIVYQWLTTIPLTSLILAAPIGLAILFRLRQADSQRSGYLFLAALSLILILLVATVEPPYYESRYTFFLFPLFIVLAVTGVLTVSRYFLASQSAGSFALVAFFGVYALFAEDVHFTHMVNIHTAPVNFRLIYDDKRDAHYWFRTDFKTPAEAINSRLDENDIVIETMHGPDYYLKKLDFIYIDPRSGVFRGVSACNGTKTVWTDGTLIYREDAFKALLSNQVDTLWIVAHSSEYAFQNAVERFLETNHSDNIVYVSLDGRLNVYRFSPPRS